MPTPIDSTEDVRRMLLARRHLDGDRPSKQAFMLRENEEYLSVDRTTLRSVQQSIAPFAKVHQTGLLSVGEITRVSYRNQALQVVSHPISENEAHCGIQGLPTYTDELLGAELVASQLLGLYRKEWP